ncbi:MAG: hypothetical protein J7598_09825 [Mitsuaria chitosanitabida]|uniref:PQQ-binding-like beta-propeller repeat protein n=1 Tax=Roseateles chitosanitabidus TaxID=65048 RepID=UPI001B247956|nr:PQQ-binding-like beta-propeller repeat protein [Roseateles chitosanitabidus]MBO9686899.1 hypothetical protein [Roseateles chitosanitabidus]
MRRIRSRPRAAWGGAMPVAASMMATAMMAGCGGNPFDPDQVDMFALSQSSVSCGAEPGTTCAEVTLYATPINDMPKEVRPGWTEHPSDGKTLVIDHVHRNLQADGRWQLSVGFSNAMKPGLYNGTIELGTDPVGDILAPLPGKRKTVSFSYRVEVTADPATRPALQAVAGAGDWTGAGGTATRDGRVAVTVDPTKIKRRWTRALLPVAASIAPTPLLSAGQVVLAGWRLEDANPLSGATVLNETDGTAVWSGALPMKPDRVLGLGDRLLFSRTTADGLLSDLAVVARGDATVVDQATGVADASEEGWTLGAGTLFVTGAGGGSVTARGLSDLKTPRWSTSTYNPPLGYGGFISWGLTVSGSTVYANVGGHLLGFSTGDGSRVVDIAVPGKGPRLLLNTPLSQSPVLIDASTAAVVTHRGTKAGEAVDNQLSVVDLAGGVTRWTAAGQFMDLPVAGNGVVYASNQKTRAVEARSAADGSLLWSWPMETADQYLQRQMVLTNGHLFVSTDRQTVALDLATHQPVWRYGAGGVLGMSANGTLTLAMSRGGNATPVTWLFVAFDVR